MIQFSVYVHPGAKVESVGGRHGDDLNVYVKARPVEGAASEAALEILAESFGVKKNTVHLLRGLTTRHKLFRIDGDAAVLQRRLDELMDGSA